MVGLFSKRYMEFCEINGYSDDDINIKVINESEKEESLKRILENKQKYRDAKLKEKQLLIKSSDRNR